MANKLRCFPKWYLKTNTFVTSFVFLKEAENSGTFEVQNKMRFYFLRKCSCTPKIYSKVLKNCIKIFKPLGDTALVVVALIIIFIISEMN